jgi:hypothetical protein
VEPNSVDQSVEADFPWGLLLITDHTSTEQIPPWRSNSELVAEGRTGIVVRVQHEQEGTTAVRVIRDEAATTGFLAYQGDLHVPSGLLRVSDAVGQHAMFIDVPTQSVSIRVYVNQLADATQVDLLLSAEPARI